MTEKERKPKEWMVRLCEEYEDEYTNCRSIKDRFHQYFIYGEYKDCSQWKKDFDNCKKFRATGDDEALKQIIESETIRRQERLVPHYMNDVWTKRDKPPENWDAPLPDWLQEKLKDSYLDVKQKGISQIIFNSQTCNIL